MYAVSIATCLLLIFTAKVEAQPQQILLSATYTPGNPAVDTSNVAVTVRYLYGPSYGITQLWISATGNPVLNSAECAFTVNAIDQTFTFSIDGTTKLITANGVTGTNCPLTSTSAPVYEVVMLSKVDPAAQNTNDQFFTLNLPGTNIATVSVSGIVAFPPPTPFPVTILTAANYNPTLTITDINDNQVTFLKLGARAKLRFTMTIPYYAEFVDDAGARLTSCKMSQNADFSAPVAEIINANGCFTAVLNKLPTQGFTGSFTNSGPTRNFVAVTPDFENINFVITHTTANQDLYFQCAVQYCSVYSAGTPGNCGGPHCDAATGRKKRSDELDHELNHIVETSVTIIGDDDSEKKDTSCKNCGLSVAYKATIAVLVGIAIILFFAMIFSYKSLMKVIEERNDKMAATMTSSMTSSSSSDVMSVPSARPSSERPSSRVSSLYAGVSKRA